MENLDKSQFIVLLETSLNRRLLSPEQKTLDAAYEDYIDLLHGLTVQSCKSSLDLLHELARLQSCLMRLQERIVEKESPQVLLLKSALLLTNFEIRLVFTRVRYPSIAAPVSVEVPKSPLFLSEQFTPTDIMELATALQLSGAIRRIDGTTIYSTPAALCAQIHSSDQMSASVKSPVASCWSERLSVQWGDSTFMPGASTARRNCWGGVP